MGVYNARRLCPATDILAHVPVVDRNGSLFSQIRSSFQSNTSHLHDCTQSGTCTLCDSASVARECGVETQCADWKRHNHNVAPLWWALSEQLSCSLRIHNSHRECPDADKVSTTGLVRLNITLLYETHCPYCQDYIVKNLYPLVWRAYKDMVNIKLVPWGNARRDEAGHIQCQHGQKECDGTTIMWIL
jgi:hypothetical protein